MRQSVFMQLPMERRLKVIRRLLASYHDYNYSYDKADRKAALDLTRDAVLYLISGHGAWPAPHIVFVRHPHGMGSAYGQADKRCIYIYLPSSWKTKTGRARFAQAIEWAKTVVHEVMHYIVNRHEEQLIRKYELDFVDYLAFTGQEVADGKPLDNR